MAGALFYFFYFAAFGIYVPYWTLYLRHLHLSSLQIAAVYSIPGITRIVFPIVFGYVADRLNSRKQILVLATVLEILPLTALLFTPSYTLLLIVMSLYSICNCIVLPFVEATVQEQHEKGILDYGRTRLWGTLSFILLALLFGKVLDVVSADWILYGFLFFLLTAALTTFVFPPAKVAFSFPHDHLERAFRSRDIWVFLLCIFLMFFSHGSFYGFYSIYLADLGFRDSGIGVQWAVAATTELFVMFFASRILQRFSYTHLFSFCLVMAVIRWAITGTATALLWLSVAQALHAFTFAAFHVTCIRLVHYFFPAGLRSFGQALYTATSSGLGIVIGLMATGWLWDRIHSETFLLSSVVALIAFFLSLLIRAPKTAGTQG